MLLERRPGAAARHPEEVVDELREIGLQRLQHRALHEPLQLVQVAGDRLARRRVEPAVERQMPRHGALVDEDAVQAEVTGGVTRRPRLEEERLDGPGHVLQIRARQIRLPLRVQHEPGRLHPHGVAEAREVACDPALPGEPGAVGARVENLCPRPPSHLGEPGRQQGAVRLRADVGGVQHGVDLHDLLVSQPTVDRPRPLLQLTTQQQTVVVVPVGPPHDARGDRVVAHHELGRLDPRELRLHLGPGKETRRPRDLGHRGARHVSRERGPGLQLGRRGNPAPGREPGAERFADRRLRSPRLGDHAVDAGAHLFWRHLRRRLRGSHALARELWQHLRGLAGALRRQDLARTA